MIFVLLCLLTFQCPAHAKSSRTVHLSESDLESIYVEPGFSTLIKFDSHPEPGLIGDQDGFKVEYLKNLVSIKPLVSRGKTNLFIFTKEGQFNFQLIASRGKHDNIVYAQASPDKGDFRPSGRKIAISINDLMTRKMNKFVVHGNTKLTLESISMPRSRATLVLKCSVETKLDGKRAEKINPDSFSIYQGTNLIRAENIFLDTKAVPPSGIRVTGFILLRADSMKKNQNLYLRFTQSAIHDELQISFSPDLGGR